MPADTTGVDAIPPRGPMAGVNVLEVATFAFVPSAGAILAEWGADVVKVEAAQAGDPGRHVTVWGLGPTTKGLSPFSEGVNRGKRSIAIDLRTDEGHEVLLRLVATADVFLTNLLEDSRKRLGIDADSVRARNSRIVYACGSGQGRRGPEATNGGFDPVSFWARSGASRGAMSADALHPVPPPAPGFGDLMSGIALAAGISAALFHRQQTGEALVVDASLLATGLWGMQASVLGASLLGVDDLVKMDRNRPPNPLLGSYRTSDDSFVALSIVDDRFWPGLCDALGRPELVDDPRFLDGQTRSANAFECVVELDETFGARPLAEWKDRLSKQDGQWAVVQTAAGVLADPQVTANELVATVNHPSGVEAPIVRAPVQFDGVAMPVLAAPEVGAHTDQVLRQAGYDPQAIATLRQHGAVR